MRRRLGRSRGSSLLKTLSITRLQLLKSVPDTGLSTLWSEAKVLLVGVFCASRAVSDAGLERP